MRISGYNIGFAGTSDKNKCFQNPKLIELAEVVGEEIMKGGHKLVSGGCTGCTTEFCAKKAAEWLRLNNKSEEEKFRIVSVLPDPAEKLSVFDLGQKLVCKGLDRKGRRPFMASLMDVLVTIEGGAGTLGEGEACLEVGTPIVPIWGTGGSSLSLWQEIEKRVTSEPLYGGTIPPENWEKLGKIDYPELGKLAVNMAVNLAKQKLDYCEPSGTASNVVFIIMPFAKRFNKVHSAIKEVIKNPDFSIPKGLEPVRADDESIGNLHDKILSNIRKARFLIVDLTGNNGNVLFEYGFGFALRKKAILLNQNPSLSLIDVANQIQIKYDLNNMQKLKEKLVKGIRQLCPNF